MEESFEIVTGEKREDLMRGEPLRRPKKRRREQTRRDSSVATK